MELFKVRRRPIILGSLCLLGLAMYSPTAQAFWQDINDLFSETYAEAQNYLDSLIDDGFGDALPFVGGAVNSSLGEIDISDPLIVDQNIRDGLPTRKTIDLTKPPERVEAELVIKEIDRQRSRSHIESVIGKEGQTVIKEKLDQVSSSITATQEYGSAAAQAFATQDVVKNMAQQNAINTELIGALHSEVINSRIDSQFSAEISANISQSLDEERALRQNRKLANVATSINLASHLRLY